MKAGVRVIHANEEVGALDVYINDRLYTRAFPFASITQYVQLPAGDNWVEVFQVGDQPKALYRQLISVRGKRCYTIFLQAKNVFIIEDSIAKDYNGTYLRFIHLFSNGPNADLLDKNGTCYFINNGYMGVTPYRKIASQTTSFTIRVSGTREILFQSPTYFIGTQQVISLFMLGNARFSSPKVLIARDQKYYVI